LGSRWRHSKIKVRAFSGVDGGNSLKVRIYWFIQYTY
jgi:hypothetical protein